MAARTNGNYKPEPGDCERCGAETINDEATWMTSGLRIHKKSGFQLCDPDRAE